MAAPSIIVADDDKSVRLVIAQALKKQGYMVHTTGTAAGMWDLSVARRGSVLITDVGFPDGDALDMLPRLQSRVPDLKVIVMSARANLLTAVKIQQRGVVDYLPKPFELKQLLETTKRALLENKPQAKPAVMAQTPIEAPKDVYSPLLGRSAVMQEVYKSLAWLSTQIVPVLIEAEPGSGKADVARALHDMGHYQGATYISVNASQLAPDEHVSVLFDETSGAIMRASGGTLFINNIDALTKDAQSLLAGALEKQTHARWPKRLLVGTTKELRSLVATDEFREDLFFAISVAPVKLPALRERKQDIPALANFFCEKASREFGVQRSLSLSAVSVLQESDWPNNIKELEFVIRRLVMAGKAPQIEAVEVIAELGVESPTTSKQVSSSLAQAADHHIKSYFDALGEGLPHTGLYDRIIEEVERPLIIQTLHLTKGNQIKAAHILGLNRNTLRKKIEMLHISKDKSAYRDK